MNEFSKPEDAAYKSIIDLDITRVPSRLSSTVGLMGFAVMGPKEEKNVETLIELKRKDYKNLMEYFQKEFPEDTQNLESAIQNNLTHLETIKPYETEFTQVMDTYTNSFEQLKKIVVQKYIKTKIEQFEKPSRLLTLKEALGKTFLKRKYTIERKTYLCPEKSELTQDEEIAAKVVELSDLFEKCLDKAILFTNQFETFCDFDKKVDKIYEARIKDDEFLEYAKNQFIGVPNPRTLNQAKNIVGNADCIREHYLVKKNKNI
ncbi:MAG: hypothetical protein KKF46_01465 [Nanoarchaeota archaeon]|nr:hypothetical protein [Nanoarchaeota archaeon]MBU1321002.1 hypothetical protein [Nanoarchaeota archaeon]MBU1596873.1 hypothetical protein [Nanoarchaeota archaeon]MBU2440788.1 hypothetical protein [Nanoarchaeota archaeon]